MIKDNDPSDPTPPDGKRGAASGQTGDGQTPQEVADLKEAHKDSQPEHLEKQVRSDPEDILINIYQTSAREYQDASNTSKSLHITALVPGSEESSVGGSFQLTGRPQMMRMRKVLTRLAIVSMMIFQMTTYLTS